MLLHKPVLTYATTVCIDIGGFDLRQKGAIYICQLLQYLRS